MRSSFAFISIFTRLRRRLFQQVANETLEYVKREMLDGSGGFYSSQDADSEGEEGKFFVWTPEEISAVVGERDAQILTSLRRFRRGKF